MKFLLAGFLLCFQLTFSQTGGTTYLKELGWSFQIPSSFSDPFPDYKLPQRDPMKRLIGVTRGRNASLVIKMDSANVFTKSNWEGMDSSATDVTFRIVERSAPYKFDTTNSLVRYDGVEFKKRLGKETITRKEAWYVVSLRTFYRDHYVIVSYTYKQESDGDEIENMLNTSKFDK